MKREYRYKFWGLQKAPAGFTGADLENLMNEAAIGAARKNNYTIRINFRERSFYKNVDNFHSLYASYQLFSEDGKCVLENVFCSESKKSILSTLVQQKQVEKIARDIKKYFENEIKSAASEQKRMLCLTDMYRVIGKRMVAFICDPDPFVYLSVTDIHDRPSSYGKLAPCIVEHETPG